ncbi:hypothetical protein HID58_093629, partial [Brassica napus]
LEELNTPSQHISFAPFVLILDENIAEAKEEFKEFLFARFSSMIFVHEIDPPQPGSPMFIAPWSSNFSYEDPQLTTTIGLVKLRGILMVMKRKYQSPILGYPRKCAHFPRTTTIKKPMDSKNTHSTR